jgi:hypothetical protein
VLWAGVVVLKVMDEQQHNSSNPQPNMQAYSGMQPAGQYNSNGHHTPDSPRLAVAATLARHAASASHPQQLRGQHDAVATALPPAADERRADAASSTLQHAPIPIPKWRDATGADAIERWDERAAFCYPSAGCDTDRGRKRRKEQGSQAANEDGLSHMSQTENKGESQ